MHAGALLLLCFVVCAVESKQTASFYGESYIRVQFQDASSSTDIELEFKSQLSYGLLFLAAGSTDYVVVELKSGLIEARLDLGSGEAVLHSQPGVRLDDLRWHTLKLARSNGNVELSIDGISTSKTQTRGQFFELNIEYGLFLGGIGNFAEAFYGTFRNYRGCLKEVYFNGYDILHAAKQLKDPLNIFEVFWQCDPVFDATSDQPVSFLADTSFLAFPAMHIRKSGTFSCDFKTRTEHGIILYNPGTAPSQDFIAVEIVDGKIKVSVDKGNGAAQMTSDTFISDGTWHQIDLFITPASLELSLDGVKKVQRFKLGDSKYINLGEHLFLGGLGYKVRASAVRKGLVTLAGSRAQTGSMKGCLRNIVVNSRVYGFREIQISRGISASCLLEFPCAANPCIAGAECTEVGRKDFRCTCDKDVCVKPTVSSAAIPDIPSEKILLILPVRGMEGAETPVTTNNIEIVFDYNEHRIRETAIIFHILLPPRHGTLEVNLNRRKTAKFSLKDLLEHKVTYLHDGTDTEADDATLEMEIVGNYPSLPHQLRERYAFVLPFTVKPRNDPPKLKLPRDDTLKIARNSRVAIHSKLLNVDDPDTKPNKLVYTVTYQDKDNGFFARSNRQDQSINTFTQAEINSGKIWYIHQGDVTSYIRLKVSDGTTDTDFSDLTVSASPLRLQVKKNTGIVLAHGTSQFIMNENLTVGANVLAQDLEVKYAIQQEPEYGEVQILQPSDNKWVKTDSFTQEQIDASQVRYVHEDIADLPPSDEFLFVASSVEARTREHRFRITLVRLQVEVDMASKLVLEHVSEKQLSHSDLKILTNAPTLKTQDISITVSKNPSAGKLFRKMDPSPHSPVEEIKNGDRFTQEEILTGMIKYKLNRMAYDALEDYVELVVSARGAQEAKFRLKIQYIPEEGDVRFVNSGLKGLPEGGQGVIESEHLHAETVEFKDFQYIVIKPVQHGELQILNSRSGTVKKTNVTQFTNQDIQRGELIYKHDDSENDRDSFTFITSPILNVSPRSVQEEQEIIELTGTFQIQINMRNDNPPQRAVDKVFQVVTNKKKIITINDLAFFDPDIDYDASKLLYKRQKIRNGEIVYAKNESIIHQFTQQDIIDGNILFHHSGKAHASSPIWVTDGQYYTTGLFEIVAMDPFVLITNNTGLVLQQGQQVVLSIFNLSVETNINVKEKDILFAITKKPANGQLLVLSRPVNAFSVDDLRKGRVAYKHGGNRNPKDNFEFTIALGDRELKQNFSISIFLESQQHPPKVIHNKMLEVEEGKSGTVEEFMLHVAHPDTAANDIVYTVVTPPKQGRLKVIGSGIPSVPLTFTQEDINSRKVRYFQTKGSETSDKFLFDVTNGFQSLQRLEFFVDIIPKNIPVEVQNLTVTEGGKVAITPKIIHVKGKHFRDAKVLYHVSKQPENGFLQFSSDPRSSLVQFSSDQIKKSEVLYVHDGNETSQDEFTIVAKTTGSPGSPTFKRSLPTTLYIAVDPVNDQPPRVTVNRGLQIWKGSMKLITSDVLSATDPDSDPEDIVFRVTTHPPNGHIAHVNNTFKPVTVFTQDLIDNNQIAFVHSGGEEGKFYLMASDGLNRDIRRSFSVVAVPLLLSMETNNRLEVYPKTLQPITKTNLFADTNDPNQTKPILYNFDTKPRYGRIVTVINGRPLAVTSFSQGEINEGKIHYQHTGYLRGWSQKDSMILEVSTLYAEPIRRERFDIDISYTNINSENQDQLIHVRQLAVKEGKEGFITRDHLDVTRFTRQLESVGKRVSIEFIIKALPEHGTMHINGRRVGENAKFTQSDIIKRSLSYRHDDSDTEMDAFELSLAITSSNEAGGDKDTSYVDSFFNITVLPVNDQPFRLVTVNPSVQVVQGFSVNITRDQLLTVDKDTKPSELIYTVINPPNNGILAFNSNPKAEIREFSQEDIDRKKVVFVSDEGKNPGAFYFKVWDGAARPYFKNFNIRIIPLKVEISKNLPVKIVQSESSVYLSQQNLDVKTNGRRDDVVYTVTRQPVFGKLYQADVEAETFKQTDIDNRHILYIQTDMTSGSDQFNFNVAIGDSLLVNQKVNISVTPLVTQNPLDAPSGSEVAITVFALDATRLATISGDNPKYNIIQRPRFGQVAMKTRGRRDSERKGPYREVSEFTHEDILYGKVFYIANPARVRADVNDSFTYLVSAYNVQPAQGVFQIKLKPPVKGVDKYPAVIPLDPDRYPGNSGNGSKSDSDPGIVSPSISTDHLLIIVFVCLIILLITIGLIVFFVWKRRKAKKKEAHLKQRPKPRPFISEPLPLNQPNVHIEPSRPHSSPASDDEHTVVSDSGMIPSISVTGDGDTMRGSQSLVQSPPRSPDLSRTEVSPTVPACKVTPLVDNEDLASGPKTPEGSAISNNSDFNFDWALMDPELLQHCRTTNPVLRKNQYWV